MKLGTWIVFGMLCLPPLGVAQERGPAPTPATARATHPTPQSQGNPEFDLGNSRVQEVIRTNARAASAPSQPQSAQNLPVNITLAAGAIERQRIPFRSPRRMHHMDCGLADCVAYNADGDALFTVPREQYAGKNGSSASDEWMSCQSSNDLLTTFERYDKCRGVGIGLPLQFRDVIVKLPIIH